MTTDPCPTRNTSDGGRRTLTASPARSPGILRSPVPVSRRPRPTLIDSSVGVLLLVGSAARRPVTSVRVLVGVRQGTIGARLRAVIPGG